MKEYRIREDKRSAYAAKKASKMALILAGGVLFIFLMLMVFVENGSQIMEVIKWHWFLIIVVGVFGLRYVQERNLATALVFRVGDGVVRKGYQSFKLNEGTNTESRSKRGAMVLK